jgi:hypothetical protein
MDGVTNLSHHINICSDCNLRFESPHTGTLWTRDNATNNICLSNACAIDGCGYVNTHEHDFVKRITFYGNWVEYIFNTDTSAEFNHISPEPNNVHRVTTVCNNCEMTDPNTSPHTYDEPHNFGPWQEIWTNYGQGCARNRRCIDCGFTQNQNTVNLAVSNGSHRAGVFCNLCRTTPVGACITSGHHYIVDTAYGINGNGWIVEAANYSVCGQALTCSRNCVPRILTRLNNHPHAFTVNLGNGRMACERCGWCNDHWSNNEWQNNGDNETRHGGCNSPNCAGWIPVEFREHTWSSFWHMNETQHWQECTTCPDSDRARVSAGDHFFGNWFFQLQTDDICQIRFEYCSCGQYNPENTRAHIFNAGGICTRAGCTYVRLTPTMMIIMAIDAYDILDAMFGIDEFENEDVNTDSRMPEDSMQDILARLDRIISRLQAGCGITGLDALDLMALEYALENNMIDFDLLDEKMLMELQQAILDGLILSESSVRISVLEVLITALSAY